VYGADKVPAPLAVTTTQWGSEEFTRGSYSYVAVGCSGKEYDTLALPVARCLLFAGEHTCKEHPDSVGGELAEGCPAKAVQAVCK
jgi:lysine-specific histone demethylase 1